MKKYDFKNEDDFKELETQAYKGIIDYSKFPPAAYMALHHFSRDIFQIVTYEKYEKGELKDD